MTIIWGWVLVSMMNIILAMVLAEICSSFPTSGGVYFFAHRLAGAQGSVCGRSVMLSCRGIKQANSFTWSDVVVLLCDGLTSRYSKQASHCLGVSWAFVLPAQAP